METQVRPYQYCGNTILVFLGEELSQQHLNAGCSFLYGLAGASCLERDLISRIRNLVQRGRNLSGSSDELSKMFSFVNVLPLLGYKDIPTTLSFLK
jgi:hypothetical protein